MNFETIQNFTILTDVKSPIDIDLANVPLNKFLRIIVKGNLEKSDALQLNQLAAKFEKYSIVTQTEVVSDLSFLKWMDNLNHFSINRYDEKYLESFAYLPDDLEQLSIASLNSSKGTLDYLRRFKNIKRLVIDSEVKDLSILKELKSLEDLQLYQVKGFDLNLLQELPNLKKLIIRFGDIRDLNPLSHLNQLEHLDLWKLKDIENLDWMENMHSLKWIKFGALNKVTNFPNLSHLKNLKYVELEQLKSLERIDNLATAPNLEKINLGQMNQIPIESYQAFLNHPRLKELTTGYSSKKKKKEIEEMLNLPMVSFEAFYFMKEF